MFTSFYAGLNTIFERDLKKLIALSTLRHLGFICMAFSLGLLSLSFFHLLSHALFKSLLFIAMGDIIINLGHSQDIRYLSSGSLYTPNSCFVMYVSLLNLLGIPSISGYFSKDMILEACNYSSLGSVLFLILVLNLFFTFYYTFQLFYYSFASVKICAYSLFHPSSFLHSFLLLVLSSLTLLFGKFFLSHISCSTLFLPVPLLIKFTPYLICALMFIYLLLNLKLFTSSHRPLAHYFSTIMFLYPLITKLSSRLYYISSAFLFKTVETGFLHSTSNVKLPSLFYFLGSKLISHRTLRPITISLLVISFSPFLFLF